MEAKEIMKYLQFIERGKELKQKKYFKNDDSYESEFFERNQSESDQSPIFVEKPKTKIFSARDNKFGPLNS
jgi:hypothetical protein